MRRFLALLLLAAAVAAFSPPAEAASSAFGVSPAELRFVDPPALAGETYDGTFRVVNRQSTPVTVTVNPEGAAAPWLTVSPASPFLVPAGAVQNLTVRIAIPEDAAVGEHLARLRVRAAPTPDAGNATSGSALAVELVPTVRLVVSGSEVIRFAFDSLSVSSATSGEPLGLVARVVNDGNVRAAPSVALAVLDASGAVALEETVELPAMAARSGGDVPFTTTGTLPAAGEYRAVARLVHGTAAFGTQESAFVAGTPSGALPAGRVTSFGPDGATVAGRPVKLEAQFTNTGATAIESARLVLEVFRDGERVAAPQSDALRIAAGATESLAAFFTPEGPGSYVAKGHVVYDGLRSPIADVPFTIAAPSSGNPGPASDPDPQPSPPAKSPLPGPAAPWLFALSGLGALALRRRLRT